MCVEVKNVRKTYEEGAGILETYESIQSGGGGDKNRQIWAYVLFEWPQGLSMKQIKKFLFKRWEFDFNKRFGLKIKQAGCEVLK